MRLMLIMSFVLCMFNISCVTKRSVDGAAEYRERFQNDYEILFHKDENYVLFQVYYKDAPIGEMTFSPGNISAIVSPYVSKHGMVDKCVVSYTDNILHTVRWITSGADTVVLYDLDGDGFPDRRVIIGPNGRVVEELGQ